MQSIPQTCWQKLSYTSENPKQCVTRLVPRVLSTFEGWVGPPNEAGDWVAGWDLRMRLVTGWGLVASLWMRWPFALSSTTAIIPTYTGGDDSSSWGLGKNEAVMEPTSAILTLTPGVEGRKPGRHRANSSYPMACCGVGPPTWEGREGKRKDGDIQQCQPKTLARWTSSLIQLPVEEQFLRLSGAKSQ